MKKIANKIIGFIIDKVKRNRFVQSLFESPINVNSYPRLGEFIDSFGNRFILYKNLRNKIKPGWESMYNSSSILIVNNEIITKRANEGRIAVEKILPIIQTFLLGLQDKKVLEIGCNLGAASYALAELGAKDVLGSEFSGYKVDSLGTGEAEVINQELKLNREKIAELFKKKSRVNFIDDDICNSKLPSSNFDLICSWDVLEHLQNPESAFQNIARLLSDGGIAINEYNPFFSLNGGHSLCTLDFLWGHARINNNDFYKYLTEFRPKEVEKAFSFFKDGLNRMTINDLIKYSNNAGLEILSLFMFTKEQHVRMLTNDILNQCQNLYHNLQAVDLVNPRIIVVHRKRKI
ncbi:MAG: hypothetical protein A2W99_15335 [Bacteroidetes bacterium GWF2_33_16]|nr:MAG: hypothetical protein A2X00_09545 [Bacteroidetes bacterium GWE2_32_14]OFY07693.1 MAG: hypothetical protein A2W99_15335 [Bacteroidetes bacterium GWF2_33_16]